MTGSGNNVYGAGCTRSGTRRAAGNWKPPSCCGRRGSRRSRWAWRAPCWGTRTRRWGPQAAPWRASPPSSARGSPTAGWATCLKHLALISSAGTRFDACMPSPNTKPCDSSQASSCLHACRSDSPQAILEMLQSAVSAADSTTADAKMAGRAHFRLAHYADALYRNLQVFHGAVVKFMVQKASSNTRELFSGSPTANSQHCGFAFEFKLEQRPCAATCRTRSSRRSGAPHRPSSAPSGSRFGRRTLYAQADGCPLVNAYGLQPVSHSQGQELAAMP